MGTNGSVNPTAAAAEAIVHSFGDALSTGQRHLQQHQATWIRTKAKVANKILWVEVVLVVVEVIPLLHPTYNNR